MLEVDPWVSLVRYRRKYFILWVLFILVLDHTKGLFLTHTGVTPGQYLGVVWCCCLTPALRAISLASWVCHTQLCSGAASDFARCCPWWSSMDCEMPGNWTWASCLQRIVCSPHGWLSSLSLALFKFVAAQSRAVLGDCTCLGWLAAHLKIVASELAAVTVHFKGSFISHTVTADPFSGFEIVFWGWVL